MATLDSLICLGGPMHGRTVWLAKHKERLEAEQFPEINTAIAGTSPLETSPVRTLDLGYRREILRYHDQPSGFSVLVHDSILDDDIPAAWDAFRAVPQKGSR